MFYGTTYSFYVIEYYIFTHIVQIIEKVTLDTYHIFTFSLFKVIELVPVLHSYTFVYLLLFHFIFKRIRILYCTTL